MKTPLRIAILSVALSLTGYVVTTGSSAEVESDPSTVRGQIEALRSEIIRHDELYHRQAAPEISDHEYDQLKRQLAELQKAYPKIADGLPAAVEIGGNPQKRHFRRSSNQGRATQGYVD